MRRPYRKFSKLAVTASRVRRSDRVIKDVRKARKIETVLPCSDLFPGCCQTRDAQHMPKVLCSFRALWAFVSKRWTSNKCEGQMLLRLLAQGGGQNAAKAAYFVMVGRRLGNPRKLALADCERISDGAADALPCKLQLKLNANAGLAIIGAHAWCLRAIKGEGGSVVRKISVREASFSDESLMKFEATGWEHTKEHVLWNSSMDLDPPQEEKG